MDRSYEFTRTSTSRIVIGDGVENRLPSLVRELDPDGTVVLHDAALPDLGQRIARALDARSRLTIPGGEASKKLQNVGDLARNVRLAGATRGTVVVAIGGGTITDLVGFMAAVLLRGVPFVACPTTTLAMCDAALGGKNGVDHGGLKNELGTIRQPHLIAGDLAWLRSLPDEHFREGIVEVVKKAAVLDAANFERLERLAPFLAKRDAAAVAEAIDMAVSMKMALVQEDEADSGRRHALNFGHTIGHALESLAAGKLRHGTCVGLGMLLECRAAGVRDDVVAKLANVLSALGVPKTVPPQFANVSDLWRLAKSDKKARAGSVPMCVPRRIGEPVEVELSEAMLAEATRSP